MNESIAPSARPPTIFPLRAVTARIKSILLEATRKAFWVRAHLIVKRGGQGGGHFYCELVDLDEEGKPVAKIAAVIWRSKYVAISQKLRDAGVPDALANNNEICAYCSLSYHELYGLSLHIHDVDPTFGEAHIDRNRRLILERLLREGILNQNKTTTVPAATLRVGLITAAGSAALSDFEKTLTNSPFGFRLVLAPATMQGENTEKEVLAALKLLIALQVEVICIVRGGGSQVDLAWFDNERIARAITSSSIPVWVGIGHEIDTGVLDHVAHTSFKTPTAVAEELVRRLKDLHIRLGVAADRLNDRTSTQILLRTRDLERKIEGLLQGSRKHFNLRNSQFMQQLLRVNAAFKDQFVARNNTLDQFAILMREKSTAKVRAAQNHLLECERRLPGLLSGFVQTAETKILRDSSGLTQGVRKQIVLVHSRLRLDVTRLLRGFDSASRTRDDRILERTLRLRSLIPSIGTRQGSLDVTARNTLASVLRQFTRLEQALARRCERIHLVRYENILDSAERSIVGKEQRLASLSPDRMLEKGYTITRDEAGNVIKRGSALTVGQKISTQFIDATVPSIVVDNGEIKNDT
jgi:exodeoxyribonuclease VII large subunit